MFNRMIKFLELDIFIICLLHSAEKKNKKISSWDIANEYNWPDKRDFILKKEAYNFYQKKTNCVNFRLKEMLNEGMINRISEKDKIFYKIANNECIKRHKISGKNMLCLMLKRKDNKRIIIEL